MFRTPLRVAGLLLILIPASAAPISTQDSDDPKVQAGETVPARLARADIDKAALRLKEIIGRRAMEPRLQKPLERLAAKTPDLISRIDGTRVKLLAGIGLGGVRLRDDDATDQPRIAVARFLRENRELYSLDERQARDLENSLVRRDWRGTDFRRLSLEQRHWELPVIDARFSALFDEEGRLLWLRGAPFPEAHLPRDVVPKISQNEAEKRAMDAALAAVRKESMATKESTVQREYRAEELQADAKLVVSGVRKALLWQVHVLHSRGLAVDRTVLLDARDGSVLEVHNNIYGAEMVGVRYLRHANGEKDDSPGSTNPLTSTTDININPDDLEDYDDVCLVRLQRLGSGRARMWNARLTGGPTTDPMFGGTMTVGPCDNLSDIDLYEQEPEDGTGIDSTYRFNEQHTYLWAQRLKTQMDNWGRNTGGEYGHYPEDSDREVNVEIVVNGDGTQESDWCGGVMHGCFSSRKPDDWFEGVADPRAVFFFNSSDNSGSPQFVGEEFTGSYSIIGHEVGHFLSWSYGSWDGDSSNMSGSLNEGFSMAIPAMWGKVRWGTSLSYTESDNVTTGSKISGNQWSHHSGGTGSDYSSFDCETTNRYQLAWPWVEAMWELANNQNAATSQSIWSSSSAAVDNTADFMIAMMYYLGGDSDLNWDEVVVTMVTWQYLRIIFGLEKGVTSNSFSRTIDVLDHHGLFDSCS